MTDPSAEPTPPLDPRALKAAKAAEKAWTKAQRPWYKKKRFIIPLAIVTLITFGNIVGGGGEEEPASTVSTPAAKPPVKAPAEEPAEEPVVEPEPAPEPEPEAPDFSKYKTLSDRELALLAKNPDDHLFEEIIIYGNVTQFDAATGACAFLARVSSSIQESTFDYETNSLFSAGDGDTDCPVLDPVVEGDSLKLWVTAMGSFSYDTQIGGNTTVPSFIVEKIQILPKTEY